MPRLLSPFLSLGHCSALCPRTVHSHPPSHPLSFLLLCQLCPLPCSEQMMDFPKDRQLSASPSPTHPLTLGHTSSPPCSHCHLQRCHFLCSFLPCMLTHHMKVIINQGRPTGSLPHSESQPEFSVIAHNLAHAWFGFP